MSDKNYIDVYDDGNIPKTDLPQRNSTNSSKPKDNASVEPLPESSRPRQDGPGGN